MSMTMNGDHFIRSESESDRFELAQRLLNELATLLAHLVDADPADASELRAEQLRYLEQQQRLRPTEHQEVIETLRVAPERLQELQRRRGER
jgi:DNA-directed RNA polymerase subunit F